MSTNEGFPVFREEMIEFKSNLQIFQGFCCILSLLTGGVLLGLGVMKRIYRVYIYKYVFTLVFLDMTLCIIRLIKLDQVLRPSLVLIQLEQIAGLATATIVLLFINIFFNSIVQKQFQDQSKGHFIFVLLLTLGIPTAFILGICQLQEYWTKLLIKTEFFFYAAVYSFAVFAAILVRKCLRVCKQSSNTYQYNAIKTNLRKYLISLPLINSFAFISCVLALGGYNNITMQFLTTLSYLQGLSNAYCFAFNDYTKKYCECIKKNWIKPLEDQENQKDVEFEASSRQLLTGSDVLE